MHVFTLTSDFGNQNFMLAGVKGKLLSSFADIQIVDICHEIMPFNIQYAATVFKHSYMHFPKGSFHFVMCNIYDHPQNKMLYAYENGQHIFCTDNGFLTMLFEDQPFQMFKLEDSFNDFSFNHIIESYITCSSLLMHGNQSGLSTIDVKDIVVKRPHYASYANNIIDAQVLMIDHFGNVTLNITKPFFEEVRQGRAFKIIFMRNEEITNLSNYYSDVNEGEVCCLFNASNYLEIAVNKGNAAQLFGFSQHKAKQHFYNNIKIFFE